MTCRHRHPHSGPCPIPAPRSALDAITPVFRYLIADVPYERATDVPDGTHYEEHGTGAPLVRWRTQRAVPVPPSIYRGVRK